jgi:two-component system response regulator DesR
VIRVLLAEDQAMVRGALASLLGLEEDIEVIAEVGRGDEVLAAAATPRPTSRCSTSGCPASTPSRSRRGCATSSRACAS